MIASAMPCANTPIQNWSKLIPTIVTLSNSSGSATSTTAITSGPMARFQPRAGGSGGASPWAPPALRAVDLERLGAQALGREAVADQEHQHHDERDAGRHARREEPALGLDLDPDLLQEPDADRAGERERQARHPADDDRDERPDQQERELGVVRARRWVPEQHAGEPGEHHADHPRARR